MTDALSIAQSLLRCPSVTPADAGALGVLEDILKGVGFETHRVTFGEPGTSDIDNLYARIGSDAPHITFAGHTDVVPAGDENAWTHGAFSGDVKDGILYGRGAVDMKGGIACSVAAVLQYLRDNGDKPKGSISFLITGDEEDISVNGTIKLLQWVAARGEKFDHCVLGEPSNVEVLGDCIKVGRRGSQSGTLYVDGVQGHVAYPHRASNPVPDISRLIVAISEEPLDHGSAQFQASNLEFTSVDVGNTASNVIPGQARAKFNIRFNDNHTQASLRDLVDARLAKACGNRIKARIVWEPSNSNVFVTKPGPFTDLAVAAIEEVTGRKPELSTSGGTSDARFISSYCPVIEFGLVGQTMHAVDERTPVSDLEKLTKSLSRRARSVFRLMNSHQSNEQARRARPLASRADGFGAGPNQDIDNPMGVGGMALHGWVLPTRTFQKMLFGKDGGTTGPDDEFAARGFANLGAWILGRNMFGPVRGPWPDDSWKGWWGDEPPYHCEVFVLTHHPRASFEMQGGTVFHFVTDGIEAALTACASRGRGKDVRLGGGVATIRQYLQAGLVDELHLAIAPALLGSGEDLFAGIDLVRLGYKVTEHAATPAATHLVLSKA